MEETNRLDEIIAAADGKPLELTFVVSDILNESADVKIDCCIPQGFKDLSSEQFIALTSFVMAHKVVEEQRFFEFIQSLLQLEDTVFTLLNDEQVKDFRGLVVPFIENEPMSKKCLVPELKLGGKTLHGPSTQLCNLVLDEYIYAEAYYTAFTKDKTDIKALNKLVALLYRDKEEWFVDYAENSELFEARMNEIDIDLRKAAYFNYMAMRNYVAKRFYKVFKVKEQLSKNKNDFGWRETTVSLAGEKFGKPKEVRTTLMLDIFVHLFKIAE